MENGAERADTGEGRSSLRGWLSFVSIPALSTALVYYFGYVTAKTYYEYFGVSQGVLNFDSTAYLVLAPDTFFRPAAIALVVGLILFAADRVLIWSLRRPRSPRAGKVGLALCIVSIALAVLGLWGLISGTLGIAAPLSFAGSAVLLEYGLSLETRYANLTKPPQQRRDRVLGLRQGLVVVVVLVGIFWAINIIAYERGKARARITETTLPLQAQAVVYSDEDLRIPGPGVGRFVLTGGDSAYRFRYNGLRALLYANDRWFLLPVGWTHVNGSTVIVLEDNPSSLRVDLAPSASRR